MTVTDESVKKPSSSPSPEPPRTGATDTERPGPGDEAEASGAFENVEDTVHRVPAWLSDPEATVNLTGPVSFNTVRDDDATVNVRGDFTDLPVRDDDATVNIAGDIHFPRVRDDHSEGGYAPPSEGADDGEDTFGDVVEPPTALRLASDTVRPEAAEPDPARQHLKGLLEALVFVSDKPISALDLAKAASADKKDVRALLAELKGEYAHRGVLLDEVAGGWIFRSSPAYATFVRDATGQKPVKLSRAQVETLAILAYRQPITRPEIDDVRGVDCGPVLKLLLERDLVRILGKKDEPGRPLLYGTTPHFLEFFGLKSLKDLPTLKEFAELTEESRRVVERELGDVLPDGPIGASDEGGAPTDGEGGPDLATMEMNAAYVDAPETIPPEAEGSPTDPPDPHDDADPKDAEGNGA